MHAPATTTPARPSENAMTTIPSAAASIMGGATTRMPHRSLALPVRGRAASVASEYTKKYSDAPGMPRSSPTSTTTVSYTHLKDAGAESVMIVEKGDKWGGTSAISGTALWLPAIKEGLEQGSNDTVDVYKRQAPARP